MGFWFLICLFAIAGLVTVQQLSVLPALYVLLIGQCCCLLVVLYSYFSVDQKTSLRRHLLRSSCCLLVFLMGMSYATWRAEYRLADYLDLTHDDRVSRLVVEISDLVNYGDHYLQFDARVLASKPADGIPRKVRLRWSFGAFVGPYQKPQPLSEAMPEIKPGEIWEVSALLRRPYGALNPGQSDMLSYRFANNHRAIGNIKGQPKRLDERGQWRWSIMVARIRHDIRHQLNHYAGDKRYGAVMIALVMGDQAAISQDDWTLFNRSGLTHLVSISGTHITMLSSLASLLVFLLIRRCQFAGKLFAERIAAQRLAALVGILVAFFYCQIAGWGVPAQRSFFMLLIFFANWLFALQWSIQMILVLAALVIIFIDPWAVLSVGFWLSFGAMLVLVMLLKEILKVEGFKQKTFFFVRSWVKTQLAVFLGLAPLLALLFNQVSLISPLANAYAIFLIGTIVTPASLLLAFSSYFEFPAIFNQSLADAIHYLLYVTLELSAKLAGWSYALLDVAALSLWTVILALFAIFTLFVARFSKWSTLSLLWLVPIFMGFSSKQQISSGEWQAYVLDIGQGSAILLSTKEHNLLFDIGPRTSYEIEATNRVIIPALRALGINHLDYVVVSHSDLDHVGGFSELVSQISVGHVYSSFRLDHWLSKEESIFHKDYRPRNPNLRAEACLSGQEFHLDGVSFRFVWPNAEEIMPLAAKSANEASCVLLVEGRFHKMLLTGDIDRAVEAELLAARLLPVIDVVVVAHHGSKTSSSMAFIKQVNADIAIAQAGHYNRYQHPDKQVVSRWLEAGSDFYNTIEEGAVMIRSTALGLLHRSERAKRKRYWH
ncbi:MAG: DNA internalization-related competence protein ComEC/Rec2 [Alcaligenaceae bacterium]|nr:DNA internalization-related competence protein ComEC/Rec2 [Alcaligenaceae bacterium]